MESVVASAPSNENEESDLVGDHLIMHIDFAKTFWSMSVFTSDYLPLRTVCSRAPIDVYRASLDEVDGAITTYFGRISSLLRRSTVSTDVQQRADLSRLVYNRIRTIRASPESEK